MSNTYILLKDLPDGSMVGDEYAKYGDQYRNERFRKDKCPVIEDAAWFTWQVENNPSWFKLKEQVEEKRIEVGRFSIQKTFGKSLDNVVYEFSCNNPIPTKKYEAVKQAIERELNADSFNEEAYASMFDNEPPAPEPQDSKEDKGWIILSFTKDGHYFDKYSFGYFKCAGFDNKVWTEPYLIDNGASIHSVRRTSDGEVFTVGETVNTNRNRGEHKIDSFGLIDGDMCVMMKTFPTGNEFLYAISKKQPKEEPKPVRQMWNTHSGIHNEGILCMAKGCEEYNPLDEKHW